jgi:hypothetical protein
MSDVSELVGRCKQPLTMSMFLRVEHLVQQALMDRDELLGALETLAGENERLRHDSRALDDAREAFCEVLSQLAAMAPVVEAAREYVQHWTAFDQLPDWATERNQRAFRLAQEIANLEAVNV